MKDYEELVRRSIRKDFARANFKRNGRAPKVPHPKDVKRIMALNVNCEYYRFRRFFVGHLVRLVGNAPCGTWVEFVRDADRERFNAAAGYGMKAKYLLYHAIFDD